MKSKLLFTALLYYSLAILAQPAYARQELTVLLNSNWLYLAADLPANDCSLFPGADAAWIPVEILKHISPRCTSDVWFRTTMPEWQGDDPAIFIRVVKQNIEVFLDSTLIYPFGYPFGTSVLLY